MTDEKPDETALCEPDKELTADELAENEDELLVNQWGEEDETGFALPLGVNAL